MGLELHFHSPIFEYSTGNGGSDEGAAGTADEGEEIAVEGDEESGGGRGGAGIGAVVALLVLVVIAFVAKKAMSGSELDEELDTDI